MPSPTYDIVDYKHDIAIFPTGHIFIIDRQSNGSAFSFDAGVYSVGDVLRIQRLNGQVTYWRNGQLFYTSLNPYTGSLYLVAKLNSLNSTVANANFVQIDLPQGTYYLGAIVDDTDVITEVEENNNSQVQTDGSGNTSPVVVSVVDGNAAASHGGGSLNLFDVLFLLLMSLYCYHVCRLIMARERNDRV